AARLEFFVAGYPQTHGSVRAILPRGSKHPVVIHDRSKELAQWRAGIALMATGVLAAKRLPMFAGPVIVRLSFSLAPPAGRSMNTPKQVWQWQFPWRRPDLDKLQRAVLDAITGVLFSDDGQVVRLEAVKQ